MLEFFFLVGEGIDGNQTNGWTGSYICVKSLKLLSSMIILQNYSHNRYINHRYIKSNKIMY